MPRSAFHFGISMNRVIALYGTGFPINPKAISMKLTYFNLQFLSNVIINKTRVLSLRHTWPQQILAILFRPFGLLHPNFKLFDFPIFFERTWWRLFQKRVVRTKFDIYVLLNVFFINSDEINTPTQDQINVDSEIWVCSEVFKDLRWELMFYYNPQFLHISHFHYNVLKNHMQHCYNCSNGTLNHDFLP